MKVLTQRLVIPAIASAAVFSATTTHAAVIGADDASDTAYDSGWTTGTDGGTGFGPWTISNVGGGGFGGGFIGGGSDIDTAGEVFGVFGNNGGTGEAVRDLDAGMSVGDTFSISMDNQSIFNGGEVGFDLQNAAGDDLISFSFFGGASNYTVTSGPKSGTTPGFTLSGLRIAVTPTAGGTFTLTVDELFNGVGIDHTVTGDLLASGDQVIAKLRLFNANGGPDAFFNGLELIPEPGSAVLIALGGLAMLRRRHA